MYGCFCVPVQPKIQKRIENSRIFTLKGFKKANHITRFLNCDHQNRNFTASKMVVSITL